MLGASITLKPFSRVVSRKCLSSRSRCIAKLEGRNTEKRRVGWNEAASSSVKEQSMATDSSNKSSNKNKRWLAIDTDAGIDDAVAICLALELAEEYGIEVTLLTCVQGNVCLEQVAVNVAKCRAVCAEEGTCTSATASNSPPIYLGSELAMNGSQVDATFFHGADGLGDVVDAIDHPGETSVEGCAIDALIDLAHQAKAQNISLTVLALGPLTNIAKAMQKEINFMCLVDELVLMGGCGNARGNVTRVAEFNVYNDAEAAEYVFREWTQPNIVVASWEFTVNHPIPWRQFDELLAVDNPSHTRVGAFLSKVLHKAYGSREKTSRERSNVGAVICDPCALVYCLDSSAVTKFERVHVEVECKGELARGMTILDAGTSYDRVARERNVKWLSEMDMRVFVQMLHRICLKQESSFSS
mmetsp:Transcript_8451/g.12525  ORF Transcript_8451/g.12525 Transcript_8451/m.12525 type:complete len:414 (-) Transcript_8451:61-1302(-)